MLSADRSSLLAPYIFQNEYLRIVCGYFMALFKNICNFLSWILGELECEGQECPINDTQLPQ